MRTCVLTGASSGIGKATAVQLSHYSEFDNIVLIGRDKKGLEDTEHKMQSDKQIIKYQFDLCNLEGIEDLIMSINTKCGSIDALINAAGYTDPQPLLNTSLKSMEYTYRINVMACFALIKESTKYMRRNLHGGKVLNVASTAGMTPRPGWLSYASSKAAVISMSQTLSEELAEYNIKVYCISPGRCATKLRKKLAPEEDPSTIMQPEEVGEIICNLVLENERCLDGQNIVVRKKS